MDYKEKIVKWVNANRKRIFHEGFQSEFREFLATLPSEKEIAKGEDEFTEYDVQLETDTEIAKRKIEECIAEWGKEIQVSDVLNWLDKEAE